jgi:hypothetical protein
MFLEYVLATLALYILTISTTVVPCVLCEEGKKCSKNQLVAALQWGFLLGLFLNILLIFDNKL